jgi:hypothetical protein
VPARGRWLRALLLAAVAVALVVAIVPKLRQGTIEGAPIADGAESIGDLVRRPSGSETVVSGFAFALPGDEVVLCPSRTRGDVPECRGSAVQLEGLDLSRLDLRRATLDDGRPYGWSAQAVTVAGTWYGGLVRVTDLVR